MITLSRWTEIVAAASDPESYAQYRIGPSSGPFSSHAMAACDGDEHRTKRRAARVLVSRNGSSAPAHVRVAVRDRSASCSTS